ncbi:hypothetical protein [Leptolyngbya sp. FACHB-321]|uniref:hypothetical protein n=1 Tax=Leptolyngbya sp. FACHB-321 TaxID=2692807 RepID=UPI001683D256|nr:hypothetical protein [Leptolyngbya sp. FACHB-321]
MKQTYFQAAFVATTISLLAVPHALAQDPLCYRTTATGQIVDLTALCTRGPTEPNQIAVSNLSLDVPEEEFLSSKVKATITNNSGKPIQVSTVMLQVSRADTAIVTIPLDVDRTLKPGQSIVASGLFDKAALQGQNPQELSIKFQGLQ